MPRKKTPTGSSHLREIADSWARERPDLRSSDYLYMIFLMRLGRVVDRVDDRRNRARYGISGPEMRVLYALRRAGKPYIRRPTDLFRALLVTSGAITKQVDKLEAAGLVRRMPDPSHGASFLVQLTPKGVAMTEEAFTALAKSSVLSPGHNKLTRPERDLMMRMCEKVLSGLEGLADDELS